jgi:hypothetical protein
MSIPLGMNASMNNIYSYMELKKKRFYKMERERSAIELDAPGMSAKNLW